MTAIIFCMFSDFFFLTEQYVWEMHHIDMCIYSYFSSYILFQYLKRFILSFTPFAGKSCDFNFLSVTNNVVSIYILMHVFKLYFGFASWVNSSSKILGHQEYIFTTLFYVAVFHSVAISFYTFTSNG